MPKAKSAATKALHYDETLAEAHAALASVHLLYDWSFREAEAEIERAIERAYDRSGFEASLARAARMRCPN